jgi:hypothetical protein
MNIDVRFDDEEVVPISSSSVYRTPNLIFQHMSPNKSVESREKNPSHFYLNPKRSTFQPRCNGLKGPCRAFTGT